MIALAGLLRNWRMIGAGLAVVAAAAWLAMAMHSLERRGAKLAEARAQIAIDAANAQTQAALAAAVQSERIVDALDKFARQKQRTDNAATSGRRDLDAAIAASAASQEAGTAGGSLGGAALVDPAVARAWLGAIERLRAASLDDSANASDPASPA